MRNCIGRSISLAQIPETGLWKTRTGEKERSKLPFLSSWFLLCHSWCPWQKACPTKSIIWSLVAQSEHKPSQIVSTRIWGETADRGTKIESLFMSGLGCNRQGSVPTKHGGQECHADIHAVLCLTEVGCTGIRVHLHTRKRCQDKDDHSPPPNLQKLSLSSHA